MVGAATFFVQFMPYGDFKEKNIGKSKYSNQISPFFVSNKGRYIWSDKPFKFSSKDGVLTITSEFEKIEPVPAGKTMKEAFLAAAKKHFPPSGTIPPELFFSAPQYNTWIELQNNQNQKDIENYAECIVKHGFPTGVFMVDGGWQKYQGNYEFKPEKFVSAKAMFEKLRKMGFKTMLWVSPFVSPDSGEFKKLRKLGLLLKRKSSDEPGILRWWVGYSASYDLTNPESNRYFYGELKKMQKEYSLDGFKFDAGDVNFVCGDFRFSNPVALPVDYCLMWAKYGLEFDFNEYRACYKMAGQPIVQRLQDKKHSWEDLRQAVSDMLAAGVLGYAYACPDMIGGGEAKTFQPGCTINEKLVVRSCQASALMPMMQFSVAPWRVLSPDNLKICRDMALLHEKFGSYILGLAKHASKTGEPIVRYMEYEFPNEGYENIKDQFMLGKKYLVAPVLTEADERIITLPRGKWRDDLGAVREGPCVMKEKIPLSRLACFERID